MRGQDKEYEQSQAASQQAERSQTSPNTCWSELYPASILRGDLMSNCGQISGGNALRDGSRLYGCLAKAGHHDHAPTRHGGGILSGSRPVPSEVHAELVESGQRSSGAQCGGGVIWSIDMWGISNMLDRGSTNSQPHCSIFVGVMFSYLLLSTIYLASCPHTR